MNNMKISPILILTALTLLLCSCATQTEYQKNMSDMTNRNFSYLRSLGYRVVHVDRSTGFIQAYKPGEGSSPSDLKMFYPNQQINPYRAVNTVTGNQDVSSITAYWLPGKDQLARRDRELAQSEVSVQSPQSSDSSIYSSPVTPSAATSVPEYDSVPKLQHKTL
jgi:hypothetical protein